MPSKIVINTMNRRLALLEKSLRNLNSYDKKDLASEVSAKFGCSLKTAKEYIRIVEWRIKHGAD